MWQTPLPPLKLNSCTSDLPKVERWLCIFTRGCVGTFSSASHQQDATNKQQIVRRQWLKREPLGKWPKNNQSLTSTQRVKHSQKKRNSKPLDWFVINWVVSLLQISFGNIKSSNVLQGEGRDGRDIVQLLSGPALTLVTIMDGFKQSFQVLTSACSQLAFVIPLWAINKAAVTEIKARHQTAAEAYLPHSLCLRGQRRGQTFAVIHLVKQLSAPCHIIYPVMTFTPDTVVYYSLRANRRHFIFFSIFFLMRRASFANRRRTTEEGPTEGRKFSQKCERENFSVWRQRQSCDDK